MENKNNIYLAAIAAYQAGNYSEWLRLSELHAKAVISNRGAK